MNRLVITSILSLIIGLMVGTGFGFRYARHAYQDVGSLEFHDRLIKHLSRKLKLSPDQRTKVSAILEAHHGEIEAIRKEFHPRFDAVRAATNAEIRAVLSPTQQQNFDEMQMRWEKKIHKDHEGHLS